MMRRIALLVAAATLVGCLNTIDTTAPLQPTETNVQGTFVLNTANGQALPILAKTTATEKWSLVADTMVIASGGTWTETATYEVDSLASVGSSTQQGVTSGTWAISNQQINFTTTGGGSATFAGTVVRNTLTVAFNGGEFVYFKP